MGKLLVLLAVTASIAGVPAASAASVPGCGYLRASVPYSSDGHADRWRVYVRGAASCAAAVKVLDAIMHLRGTLHQGMTEAGAYFTDSGWLCPVGQMGMQSCELPTRLPAHPPIRARALAINCATAGSGCPAELPSSDL